MDNKTKLRFFEQGGGQFFVSVTSSRTRERREYGGTDCILLKTWDDVLDYLRELTSKITHESHLELIEIFTKPRVCWDCLDHATQPEMFDVANAVEQCLCWVEENPGCPVHKFGKKKEKVVKKETMEIKGMPNLERMREHENEARDLPRDAHRRLIKSKGSG